MNLTIYSAQAEGPKIHDLRPYMTVQAHETDIGHCPSSDSRQHGFLSTQETQIWNRIDQFGCRNGCWSLHQA